MNALRCIVPLILTLALLPANSATAAKIDDLLAGEPIPRWSPVANYQMPSCYLGNCDFESPTLPGFTCIPEDYTDSDYSRCTAQDGACSNGCAGTQAGVPESRGNCYPAY